MLSGDKSKLVSRRIFIDLVNQASQKILHCLLTEWEYQVLATPEPGGVCLIEQGRPIPPEAGPLIQLVPSRYLVPGRVCIPISLEELWTQLENRFHRIPRRHIRKEVSFPATAMIRGESWATTVVSMSDWGCRFSLGRELAEGETIELEINIAKISVALTGRIIYSMPRCEATEGNLVDLGMMFDGISPELRIFLRRNLILGYLVRVKERLSMEEFQAGVGFLNLSPRILESLGCVDPFRRTPPS